MSCPLSLPKCLGGIIGAARRAVCGKTAPAAPDSEIFIRAATHQLRAPIRLICSFSQLLRARQGNGLPPEALEDLEQIERASLEMSALLDSLAAMLRLRSTSPVRERVDPSRFMRALAADVTTDHGQVVEMEIGPLPACQGDPILVREVFRIMLENAVKFTAQRGEPRIGVGGKRRDGQAVYYVRDNGVGFDPSEAGRIFKPFGRLHGDGFAGSGLGLAIVRDLVGRMEGRAWAEGKKDEGATFWISLPASSDE